MAFGGAALKFIATALYALEFCCAAVILGIYSYFLAVQADRNVTIPRWQQAVEGLSGATVLYTIFAIVFDRVSHCNQVVVKERKAWLT